MLIKCNHFWVFCHLFHLNPPRSSYSNSPDEKFDTKRKSHFELWAVIGLWIWRKAVMCLFYNDLKHGMQNLFNLSTFWWYQILGRVASELFSIQEFYHLHLYGKKLKKIVVPFFFNLLGQFSLFWIHNSRKKVKKWQFFFLRYLKLALLESLRQNDLFYIQVY